MRSVPWPRGGPGLALLLLLPALAGCFSGPGGAQACQPGTPDGPVNLGLLLPESGQLSELAPDVRRAVELAIDQVNTLGGISGEQVELIVQDSGGDPDIADRGYRALVEQGAFGVVGPLSGNATGGLLPAIEELGTPVISPAASADELVEARGNSSLFMTLPPDGLQGKAIAGLLLEDGISSAATLAIDTRYGQTMAGTLADRFEAEGGQVLAQVTVQRGPGNHSQALETALANDPEALVYLGFPGTGRALFQQLFEDHEQVPSIYFSEGSLSPRFVAAVGQGPDGTALLAQARGTTPEALLEGTEHESFHRVFDERYGHAPGLFAPGAYDAAIGLLLAATPGSLDPDAVTSCLEDAWNAPGARMGADDLEQATARVKTGGALDYTPVSGAADWEEDGAPGAGTYAVWEVTEEGTIDVVREGLTVRR